jgi:hypothetical protein
MKTRKKLIMYKLHHPTPDIDRIYVQRKEDEAFYKLKGHIRERKSILQNVCTQNTQKTSL